MNRLYSLFIRSDDKKRWKRATFLDGSPMGAYHINNARRVFQTVLIRAALGESPYGSGEHRLRPIGR